MSAQVNGMATVIAVVDRVGVAMNVADVLTIDIAMVIAIATRVGMVAEACRASARVTIDQETIVAIVVHAIQPETTRRHHVRQKNVDPRHARWTRRRAWIAPTTVPITERRQGKREPMDNAAAVVVAVVVVAEVVAMPTQAAMHRANRTKLSLVQCRTVGIQVATLLWMSPPTSAANSRRAPTHRWSLHSGALTT